MHFSDEPQPGMIISDFKLFFINSNLGLELYSKYFV